MYSTGILRDPYIYLDVASYMQLDIAKSRDRKYMHLFFLLALLLLFLLLLLLRWLRSLLPVELGHHRLEVLGLQGNLDAGKGRVLVGLDLLLLLLGLLDPLAHLGHLGQDLLPLLGGNVRLLGLPLGHEILHLAQLLGKGLDRRRSGLELLETEQYLLERGRQLGVLVLEGREVGVVPVLVHPLLGVVGELLDLLPLLVVAHLGHVLLVVDQLVLDLVDVALDLVLGLLEHHALLVDAGELGELVLGLDHHLGRVGPDATDVEGLDLERLAMDLLLLLLDRLVFLDLLLLLDGGFGFGLVLRFRISIIIGVSGGIVLLLVFSGSGFLVLLLIVGSSRFLVFLFLSFLLDLLLLGLAGLVFVVILAQNLLGNGNILLNNGFGLDERGNAARTHLELQRNLGLAEVLLGHLLGKLGNTGDIVPLN
mmetsp:Transcript_11449/g.32450  ORF Transcript_11449/g.32450 Transcript_11449/m.32450 type:complete len:423 (-) Transcript_11449:1599-2867(-)